VRLHVEKSGRGGEEREREGEKDGTGRETGERRDGRKGFIVRGKPPKKQL